MVDNVSDEPHWPLIKPVTYLQVNACILKRLTFLLGILHIYFQVKTTKCVFRLADKVIAASGAREEAQQKLQQAKALVEDAISHARF
jgi:hypothetical protein